MLDHPAGKSELTTVKDANDGYEFGYPFGWQEVSVQGQVRPKRTANEQAASRLSTLIVGLVCTGCGI